MYNIFNKRVMKNWYVVVEVHDDGRIILYEETYWGINELLEFDNKEQALECAQSYVDSSIMKEA